MQNIQRKVFPYLAKMKVGANNNYKFAIQLPHVPCRVSRIIITSSQNITITGGNLFSNVVVNDQLESTGREQEPVDIDGSLTLGGVAGTEMTFNQELQLQGENLTASEAKILVQLLVIARGQG